MGLGAQPGAGSGELEANSRRGSNAPKVAPATVSVAPARDPRQVMLKGEFITTGFCPKALPDFIHPPSNKRLKTRLMVR